MAASEPQTSSTPSPSQESAHPVTQPFFRQPGPKLLLGGGLFALFSALTTRRALARRRRPPTLSSIITSNTKPSAKSGTSPVAGGTRPKGSNAPRMQWPGEKTTSPSEDAIGGEMKDDLRQLKEAEAGGPEQQSYTQAPNTPPRSSSQQDSGNPSEPNIYDTGPFLALEALSLATINVVAWGMLTTGFGLWYYDIKSLEDMRRKIRGGLGVDGTGRTEKDVEEEMEEWVVGVLERSRRKKGDGDDGHAVRDGKGRARRVDDGSR